MKAKMIQLTCIFISVFFSFTAFSQTTIKGHVFDKESYQPIENVTIQILNRNMHDHSNKNGYFYIGGVQKGDTLEFDCLTYQKQQLIFKGSDTTLQIFLSKEIYQINEITISSQLKQLNSISTIDLTVKPVNTAQEVLRKVPGLFIAQHQGGGKAEQIFLRGVDNDHGTDIAISADGIPVNLVSHAHGQGYADCHFIIPETIKKIDFGKGPYYTDKGDFCTTGYVNYKTFDRLDKNKLSLEVGQFNTLRTVGLFKLMDLPTQSAYVATEYFLSDGPFIKPQNFHRINLFGKYHALIGTKNFLTLSVSNFNSKWGASGQIPERAVKEGIITRFGSIDSSENGETARTNISIKQTYLLDSKRNIENFVYFSKYNFELYSDFTFFLNDSVNGDLIRQKENRTIYGYSSVFNDMFNLGNIRMKLSTGIGGRFDNIYNDELSHTNGHLTTLEQKSLGDIFELNEYGFTDLKFETNRWTFNTGARVDYFKFNYNDKLSKHNPQTKSVQSIIVSPKLNILFSPNKNWQFYLKSGKGFHSNDTRVVVAENGIKTLPAVYGADIGFISKNFNKIILNASLWYLFMQQEFVYSGDEAVVEPNGRTERYGADFSARFEVTPSIYTLLDVNYAHPRFLDLPEGKNFVPLAPVLTSTGGIFLKDFKRFSGGINFRYMSDRPAIEDNTFRASGYFVTDCMLDYNIKNFSIGFNIENLFNTEWNEAQFLTETRLKNETSPISDICYTPGTPFNFKVRMSVTF